MNNFTKNLSVRFILAGAWNTFFGFVFGLYIYNLLHNHYHILVITFISNVFCIYMSFLVYKIFVFRSKGNWLKETLKTYILYGFGAFFSMIFIWISVEFGNVQFWIAQGIVIPLLIIYSFIGNKLFTFNNSY